MPADLMDRQSFPDGKVIFKQGDQANSAYVVQEGNVEIYLEHADHETILATIPKGGIFGEMALIDDKPRSANARMLEGGTLLVINKGKIDAKLAKADPFIRTLLNIFVQTIRRMSDEKE